MEVTTHPQSTGGSRIGVEIGGTFTDMVWLREDGVLQTGKTPSTPQAIHEAVFNVIGESGANVSALSQITHGSTVATNALITRRGAKVALLTTRGFRDVLVIGRGERDHDIYSMQYRRSPPLIRRSMIREIDERVGPDGEIVKAIDLAAAWAVIQGLLDEGVDGIAVSLLHAYRNPEHERAIAEMIRERAPGVAVSASYEVSPEFREYERSVTTVVNSFVGPVVENYIGKLDKGLRQKGYDGVLHIMQSNGGVMPASAAGSNAVRMLLSGPAAGVRAAIWFARRNGIENIITLDMGGTSTDVALAPNLVPGTVAELTIDGLPVRTASVDMETIGAGGGSIASVDRGGFLTVGPESAGARPGPACYGHGGNRPTVTDAQLVTGLLRADRFFGGKMTLDMDAAMAALATIDLPVSPEQKADSILRLVNSNMASAVRLVSTGRGIDPRTFTMVAFGGGGPLHGAMVAEEIGIREVLVPWSPGLASAFGLLIADTIIDASSSDLHTLCDTTLDFARIERLREMAGDVAASSGLAGEEFEIIVGLDMRYASQAFELTIWTAGEPLDATKLRQLFEDEHRLRYGYARGSLDVEVVAYRLRLYKAGADGVTTPLPEAAASSAGSDMIDVQLGGKRHQAQFALRRNIAVGGKVSGPAILAEPTSTVVVPAGWEAECLPSGDLLLRDKR
jgi:N-methylhydantoinase A